MGEAGVVYRYDNVYFDKLYTVTLLVLSDWTLLWHFPQNQDTLQPCIYSWLLYSRRLALCRLR